MKNVIILSTLIFSGLFIPVNSCILKIEPAQFNKTVNDTVEFTVYRQQTCGRCLLPLEQTQIEITNGTLLTKQPWTEGRASSFTFSVKFETAGDASVQIIRNCPRGYITATSKGIITAAVTQETPRKNQAPDISVVKQSLTTATDANNKQPALSTHPAVAMSLSSAPHDISNSQDLAPKVSTISDTVSETNDATMSPISSSQNSGTVANNSNNTPGLPFAALFYVWILFLALAVTGNILHLSWLRKPLLFVSIVTFGFYSGGCPCSVGDIFNFVTGQPVKSSAVLLMSLLFIVTLIRGRVFCGWMCPIGAIQEFVYCKPVTHNRFPVIDKIGKYLKFVVLAAFLFVSWKAGQNIYCGIDPFKSLFNFSGAPVSFYILSSLLLFSVFLSRPFCRYFCPLGAVLSLISKFSIFKIRISETSCISCKACTKNICPSGAITFTNKKTTPAIDKKECIQCGKCTDTCKVRAITNCI